MCSGALHLYPMAPSQGTTCTLSCWLEVMREEVDVQVLTLGHLVPHQTVGMRVSANTTVGEGPLSSLVQGTTLVGGTCGGHHRTDQINFKV